jgi:hypothetical protein
VTVDEKEIELFFPDMIQEDHDSRFDEAVRF